MTERFGGAPAVRVAKAGEHGAGRREAERVNQFAAEEAERDGVQQERALAGESDDPAFGREFEQFTKIQIGRTHVVTPITLIGRLS